MAGKQSPCARIRRQCLECMGEHRPAVAECATQSCALHAFRDCYAMEVRPLVRAIRRFCLQCTGGDRAEVRTCTAKRLCPLWPYRLGVSPHVVSRHMDRRRRPRLPGL
jgi:hypothetical protein